MRPVRAYARSALFGTVAASALFVATGLAQAGGLAVREQSTSAQGSSFAGSAAGYDLSSSFWNPAAFGVAGWGFTSESHAALIIPNGDVTGVGSGPGFPNALPSSTDIGLLALVPASYYAYRFNKDLVLGLSINSPFGLTTKPDPYNWQGQFVAQTSKVLTFNATPTLSYQVAPGLFIGAGVQLEYAKLKLMFADGATPTATADVDDNLGVGFTAGVLWQPTKSTSIGLGYRSTISHDLDGTLRSTALGGTYGIGLTFDTPEIATLSIRQAVAPHMRLLGTIEWTNWSRFDRIPVSGITPLPNAALEGPWHDGWFYSLGLEYDVSHKLTLRTGLAFEKSPIQNANERLLSVPDSDRWWLSGGLTYKWSERLTFDFAYTHIFFDDAPINRSSLSGTWQFAGEADQSADIVSVSVKTKW
jgi:long-chain fatty acid transport protein